MDLSSLKLIKPNWKPTTKSVRNLLSKLEELRSEFWDSEEEGTTAIVDFDEFDLTSDFKPIEVYDLGNNCTLHCAECFGGSEGDGEEHWLVVKIKHNSIETCWMVPGWYASYDGGELEWENAYQVESYEKTVIAWREKK